MTKAHGLIGDDADGLCVLNALKRAAELAGRPDIVMQQDIDQFVDDQLIRYAQDLRKGTTWEVVERFLERLYFAGREFNFNAITKKNYMKPGRRGVRVMGEITVADGIYIVGAYNHGHVGHAAVLTIQWDSRFIYDSKHNAKSFTVATWINFYAFIRPFIVFK